ncbi:hypothetical protein D3C76_1417470 [compost metagenome]
MTSQVPAYPDLGPLAREIPILAGIRQRLAYFILIEGEQRVEVECDVVDDWEIEL